MAALTLDARIEALARGDRRYSSEAYHFVFEALDYSIQHPVATYRPASRHVTVTELLEGIRRLALDQLGPLARCVFESWGVYETEDFGEIVFNLIENGLLNRSESDRKEDFAAGFSFREVFEEQYRPTVRLDES